MTKTNTRFNVYHPDGQEAERAFQVGDIVACWGSDPVSSFISLRTSWPFGPAELRFAPSHVSMIGEYGGKLAWYESTTKCGRKCLHDGRTLPGFQVHEPNGRVADYLGQGGGIAVYRLSGITREVFDEVKFHRLLRRALDLKLLYAMDILDGAIFSGTWWLKNSLVLSRWLPGIDETDVFCSEIISKFCQELGLMNRRDPRWFNPGGMLRELVGSGVYRLVYKQWG